MTAGLFLCLFASQSAVIAIAPSLSAAAADLGVSISAAGQLRTITGLVAGVTALALGLIARRVSLRRRLLAGTVLLAAGATASAAAGSYAVLALAQVPVGAGVAVLTTAAVVAAAEWAAAESRTAVLSWTLNGQPAAWIVGMPIHAAGCPLSVHERAAVRESGAAHSTAATTAAVVRTAIPAPTGTCASASTA